MIARRILAAASLATVLGCSSAGNDGPWNVLILVPDTVRSDHLSSHGYGRETTPRLDALARDGVRFGNAVTVAPRTWQSFSSILTGLYPPHHGVRYIFDEPIPADTPIIASVLREHGYATAAFDAIPFLRGMTGGRGFEEFRIAQRNRPKERQAPDPAIADDVVEWVSTQGDAPYLAFVRFSGAHWPYTNGDRAHTYHPCEDCDHGFNYGTYGIQRGKRSEGFILKDADAHRRLMWQLDPDDESRAHRIAHYDAELFEMDSIIGDVLDRLDRAGALERTLVVVTSDHGESFGEHGYLQHGPRVDHTVMRVPLILNFPRAYPRRPSGIVRSELARVIDVFPTVLDVLGIAAPEGLDGTTLLPLIEDREANERAAYGESGRSFLGTDPERIYPGVEGKQRMLQTDAWKLVWTPGPGGGTSRLYDLQSDPQERLDVAAQHPDRVASLRAQLFEIDAGEALEGPAKDLSVEEIERLKQLGYMQ